MVHSASASIRFAATLLLAMLLSACTGADKKKKTDWSVSLDGTDKKPYGLYLARQSMAQYFPRARIETLNRQYRYTSMSGKMLYGRGDDDAGKSMMVLVGLDFRLGSDEWANLKTFVKNGNELVVFCALLDDQIQQELQCEKQGGGEQQPLSIYNTGAESRRSLALSHHPARYGHTGRSLTGYFTTAALAGTEGDAGLAAALKKEADRLRDSTNSAGNNSSDDDEYGSGIDDNEDTDIDVHPAQLGIRAADTMKGYKVEEESNFIRYTLGQGHITLHAAPLALSNYFLLQPGNRDYLDGIWHAMPAGISTVYWHEYFQRQSEESSLGVLWRYPATRWAIIIALLTIILYVIFESRRKQRIIPDIPPLQNASVSFVETVGHLYYNQRNHANLANKMILHYLEWVRLKFGLDTSQLSPEFARQLSARSGMGDRAVHDMIHAISQARMGQIAMTDAQLSDLYFRIQAFYNSGNKSGDSGIKKAS